jgi:hypothetical protein
MIGVKKNHGRSALDMRAGMSPTLPNTVYLLARTGGKLKIRYFTYFIIFGAIV